MEEFVVEFLLATKEINKWYPERVTTRLMQINDKLRKCFQLYRTYVLDTSRVLCHPIHHGSQSGNA